MFVWVISMSLNANTKEWDGKRREYIGIEGNRMAENGDIEKAGCILMIVIHF